jgi:phosphatidylglycerophosphate synthase
MTSEAARGWALVIDPARGAPSPEGESDAAATERAHGAPALGAQVLGLSLPLRLALSAQAAGATLIAAASELPAAVRADLRDPRLRLRVVDELDLPGRLELRTESPSVRVPANTVIHRETLRHLAHKAEDGELLLVPPLAGDPGNAVWHTARGSAGAYGFDPVLVVDDRSRRLAEQLLLRSLRKHQDGWTSTYLNRPISLTLTRWLVATGLRPNQVSIGILGVGIAGALLASRGTYLTMLIGALLFHAQSVLDGCDGEMSRITFRGSRTGEWLDTIGDDLTNYGFFAGAAWGLYTSSGRPLYLALGGVMVISGLLGSGLEYRYLIRIGSGDLLRYPLGIGKAPGGAADKSALGRALDAVSPLFKRDTFVFLTLIGAALGWLGPFLAIFAAGAVGVLIAVLRAELRMLREGRARAGG